MANRVHPDSFDADLLVDLRAATDRLIATTEAVKVRVSDRDEIIRELVERGISCRTIAKHTNVSYAYIQQHFYQNGRYNRVRPRR